MLGICPRVWVVPLKLREHVENVHKDPSGPFTLPRPPSPFEVLPPWFLNLIAYLRHSFIGTGRSNLTSAISFAEQSSGL